MPDKILAEIVGEHLPYEIDMLRLTYQELEARAKKPAPESQQERACHDALIEAFCVHARSLLHFFADKKRKGRTDDDAIASDFTIGFVTGLQLDEQPLEAILTRLNKQIFHLTTERTVAEAGKFNVGTDGLTLLKLIEPEIEKFTTNLRPEFQSFKCKTSPIYLIASLPFSSTTALAAQTTPLAAKPK